MACERHAVFGDEHVVLVYMGVDVAYAGMKGFGVEQRLDKIGREFGCGEEEEVGPHAS